MNYYTYIDDPCVKDRRLNVSPAALSKSGYIISKLKKMGASFTVVTLARTTNEGVRYPDLQYKSTDKVRFLALEDKMYRSGIRKYIFLILYHFRVFQHFIRQDKADTAIVYHSLMHAMELCVAKKIRGFNLILELEEVYQDVVQCGKIKAYWEKKIIEAADGYILATDALSKVIPQGKPYIVVNGNYSVERDRNVCFDDNKIHCVYAGTFDPTKGGAAAAAAAAFLPKEYCVHILGFGSKEEIENIKKQVVDVQKKAKCKLSYEGLKSGEEYIRFLQKCHIGLCTQIPDAKYAETSFPSKVLVYLANGLRVLSARIPAVENSEVGELLYYYDTQTPQEIAKAIMKIPMQKGYDSRYLLDVLDKSFEEKLKRLMEKISNEID